MLFGRVSVFVCSLLLLGLAGCSGDRAGGVSSNEAQSEPVKVDGLDLSSPTELASLLAAPRGTSYAPEDLIQHGGEYDPALPFSNVSVAGDEAAFAPNWPAGGAGGLAYCCYSFDVLGYTEEPEVLLSWEAPPADYSTIYIGLAEWDSDTWHFVADNPAGPVVLPSLDPFIDGAGRLVVIVVAANAEAASLDWIRLGVMPEAIADLDISANDGVAPLLLDLPAFQSEPGIGEIVKWEWDFDGDGTYDSESTTLNFEVHIYDVGDYNPGLRITTEYGVQDTDSDTLHVVPGWSHTWGSSDIEYFLGVTTDGQVVYSGGNTKSYGEGNSDALILKYDLAGSFQWARAWGGPDLDQYHDIYIDSAGNIYAMGESSSFTTLDHSLLLQSWSSAGSPVWTAVWEYTDQQYWQDCFVFEDAIYSLGTADTTFGDTILVKFNTAGEFQWARKFGTEWAETGAALTVVRPEGGNVEIHTVSRISEGADEGMMYCKFDDAGQLLDARRWASVADEIWPQAIYVHLIPAGVYISGFVGPPTSTEEVFMIEQVDSGATVARAWTAGAGISSRNSSLGFTNGYLIMGGLFGGAGALLKVTRNGNLIGAAQYNAALGSSVVWDLTTVYDQGILVAGKGSTSTDGEWIDLDLTARTTAGSWSPLTVGVTEISGTVTSPSGVLTYIIDGVHDTGGGGNDGLVSLTAVP